MKVCLSSLGKDVNSKLSEVFGRCPYFIFVQIDNNQITKTEILENTSASQQGGAGISSAQIVAENNADAVITGTVGPRALDVLNQFNIKIFSGAGLVKEVVQEFISGKLKQITK